MTKNDYLSNDNGNILIVDDEESIRSSFSDMLKHSGFDVDTAENASTARKILQENGFDAIFCDILMPETDGMAFLKIIKEAHPDTQVIMVTGYPTVDTASEAVRSGAYDYLTKPVSQKVLARVARKAVETKKLKEEKRRLENENQNYRKNLEKLIKIRTNRLLESEKRYSIATKAAMVGVWDWNLSSNKIYLDPNLKAMLGYENHEIKNDIDEWSKHVHPDDLNIAMAEAEAHMEGLTDKYEVSHRMLHKDGTIRWFLARGTVVRDAKGVPYRMLGTDSDITAQKEAEAELKRRNAVLEAVRFASDAFLRSEDWGELINEALARLGRAAEVSRVYIFRNKRADNGDLQACHRYEWVKPGIKPEIDNPDLAAQNYRESGFGRWEAALSKGQPIKGIVRDFPESEQAVLARQDTLSVLIVPIFVDGLWWGFIGFDECTYERDWSSPEIEALKVAAGTLGAALHTEQHGMERRRLVTAIEQSSESVIITAPDGMIQYVNPTFEKISGYKRDEVIGQLTTDFLRNNRHFDQSHREMIETVQKGRVWHGHLVNRRKNGVLFEEEATVSPVRNAEGKIVNYVAIKRDVTEKKRLESIAEAANLMENIGYVFSGIRHEIGNPINSLKMTLTVLNKSLDAFSRETVQEFLVRSLNEVTRVEYLLKALRNFNLFEQPKVQSLRIDTFMEKFVTLVANDFERKGIRIKTLSSAWAMKGLADPRALHQVMLNLMTNSAHALTQRDDPCIAFAFNREGGWIQLKVIDNGCGMSPEQKKDLFKPFFTTKAGGTGLGLVIVKKMLSHMNCTIDIESEQGQGTTVTLSIPEG